MLSTLQLVATPAAQPLADALVVIKDMYLKHSRKVPATAPLEFVPESWHRVVITPAGIDRQYYEFCALSELKGALRSGDIWVKGSRRYKILMITSFPKRTLTNSLRRCHCPYLLITMSTLPAV